MPPLHTVLPCETSKDSHGTLGQYPWAARRHRVSLEPALLSRTLAYGLDDDLSVLLTEMLDTARLSGCSEVEVEERGTATDRVVSVSDDGNGLNLPDTFGRFGQQGCLGGEGLAPLALRGVEVRTRARGAAHGYQLTLSEANSEGLGWVRVVPLQTDAFGTTFVVSLRRGDDVRAALECIATYVPFPVHYRRRVSEEITEAATFGQKPFLTANAVTVVAGSGDHADRVEVEIVSEPPVLNGVCGGRLCAIDAPTIDLFDGERVRTLGFKIQTRHGDEVAAKGAVAKVRSTLRSFLIEAGEHEPAYLLPATKGLDGRTTVARSDWTSEGRLARWRPSGPRLPSKGEPLSPGAVICDADICGDDAVMAALLLLAAPVDGNEHPIYCSQSAFTGYPWYDGLPRVRGVTLEVDNGDATFVTGSTLDCPRHSYRAGRATLVDDVCLHLEVWHPAGGDIERRRIPIPFAVTSPSRSFEDASIFLPRTPTLATPVSRLVDVIEAAFNKGRDLSAEVGALRAARKNAISTRLAPMAEYMRPRLRLVG